jgi:hypothetical protein
LTLKLFCPQDGRKEGGGRLLGRRYQIKGGWFSCLEKLSERIWREKKERCERSGEIK